MMLKIENNKDIVSVCQDDNIILFTSYDYYRCFENDLIFMCKCRLIINPVDNNFVRAQFVRYSESSNKVSVRKALTLLSAHVSQQNVRDMVLHIGVHISLCA